LKPLRTGVRIANNLWLTFTHRATAMNYIDSLELRARQSIAEAQ
jgi:hypothetical protein